MKPTQEQVIAWAREAGFEFNSLGATYTSGCLSDLLKILVAIAYEAGRADENAACAKECWEFYSIEGIAQKCNAAIRARREQ